MSAAPPFPPAPPAFPATLPPPPPPPPPARKGGSGFRWLWILGLLVLLGSIGINVLLMFAVVGLAGGAGGSSKVAEETIVSGSMEKVAILPIAGTIDESMADRVREYVQAIKADGSIKAVVVEVDSPGGGITASDEIYHRLQDLKQSHPHLAISMRSLAASGGYYVSMASDNVCAEPTTLTGSIGVIWPAFQVNGLLDKIGVKPEMVTSDEAKYKDSASPFKPFTDEDRAYIKGLVNHAHKRFRGIVASGRGAKLTVPMEDVAIGKIFTADDALKMGLIDKLCYLDDVVQDVAKAAGLHNPTVVRLKEKHGLAELLGGAAMTRGARVEISTEVIDKLRTPRLEYRALP